MRPERDSLLRFRPLVPAATLAYAGAMLIAAPYFLRTYYTEVLSTVGVLVITAAIVMYFGQRVERRIENVLKLQGRLADAGIDGAGIVTRHDMSLLLKQFNRGLVFVVVNREDSKLLVDLLRFFDDPREGPRRVIVADWTGYTDSHEERAIIPWVRDLARGAEFRVSKRRATGAVLVSDRNAILMSALSRERGVYLFAGLSRWSQGGDLLIAEADQLWSEASAYAEPSPTAVS